MQVVREKQRVYPIERPSGCIVSSLQGQAASREAMSDMRTVTQHSYTALGHELMYELDALVIMGESGERAHTLEELCCCVFVFVFVFVCLFSHLYPAILGRTQA